MVRDLAQNTGKSRVQVVPELWMGARNHVGIANNTKASKGRCHAGTKISGIVLASLKLAISPRNSCSDVVAFPNNHTSRTGKLTQWSGCSTTNIYKKKKGEIERKLWEKNWRGANLTCKGNWQVMVVSENEDANRETSLKGWHFYSLFQWTFLQCNEKARAAQTLRSGHMKTEEGSLITHTNALQLFIFFLFASFQSQSTQGCAKNVPLQNLPLSAFGTRILLLDKMKRSPTHTHTCACNVFPVFIYIWYLCESV